MSGVLLDKKIALGLVELYNAWKSGKLLRSLLRGQRVHTDNRVMGKLDGEFTAGGSATVNIWASPTPYSEVETGRTITAHCRLLNSGTIAAGTWVFCEIQNGNWQIYAYDCG